MCDPVDETDDMGNRLTSVFGKSNLPVVVILGATGTGKSKLGIQLAKKYNGEIISADSMQVYKGLDIITNKVTPEEQKEAVHHFVGDVDPLSQYTVVDFRNRAVPVIDRLIMNNKLPIIAGGTNYYIESLLWKVLIKPESTDSTKLLYENEKELKTGAMPLAGDTSEHSDVSSRDIDTNLTPKDVFQNVVTRNSLKDIPSPVLHKILSEVDPDMAQSTHPNDRRKILRSLQVYQQHKQQHSRLLELQKSQTGGSSLGGPLRYKNSIMLWIQCDKSVLHKRLDDRVDQMVKMGLIDELLDFHRMYNENRIKNERGQMYEEGIFQSIGFKEFHEYLILSEEERNSEKGLKMLEKGIEDMKVVTRQYSRKQMKWILNRFVRKPDREVPPVYCLNATDVDEWEEHVFGLACQIVDSVLQGNKPDVLPLGVETRFEDVKETHYCEVCEKVIIGRRTWEAHIKSRKHYKRKASLNKRNERSAVTSNS